MRIPLIIILCIGCWSFGSAQILGRPFGINICGGEFEEHKIPGVLHEDYDYPSEEDIEYFYQQGFQLMTIPFKWERLQHQPGGPIDQANLQEFERILTYCAPRNISVIFSMHNFGRYTIDTTAYIVGSPLVTRADFASFWTQMASALKNHRNLYGFEIMSEPHHMEPYGWLETAQQAINAIRTVDAYTNIIISGNNYANAEQWRQYSDELKQLSDPSDKLVYDAHCYFDKDYSGRYKESYDSSGADQFTGVIRIMPFIRWLKDNHKKGIVGEYGVPDNDIRWFKLLDNFLKYLSENNVNGCYWAAGSRWNNYPLSVQPFVQADRPQMETLLLYKKTRPSTVSSFGFLLPESFLFLPNMTLTPVEKGGVYAPASIEKNIKVKNR